VLGGLDDQGVAYDARISLRQDLAGDRDIAVDPDQERTSAAARSVVHDLDRFAQEVLAICAELLLQDLSLGSTHQRRSHADADAEAGRDRAVSIDCWMSVLGLLSID